MQDPLLKSYKYFKKIINNNKYTDPFEKFILFLTLIFFVTHFMTPLLIPDIVLLAFFVLVGICDFLLYKKSDRVSQRNSLFNELLLKSVKLLDSFEFKIKKGDKFEDYNIVDLRKNFISNNLSLLQVPESPVPLQTVGQSASVNNETASNPSARQALLPYVEDMQALVNQEYQLHCTARALSQLA